ncbi:753118c8-fda4-43e6-9521-3727d64494d4 [Thermothielavioides terrestris]|uniref:753118c8-fda4-43e6-9521-3727d64494d4 n=1 Tax=Thermothielavioides terrestris TaxID=2587410 RepID=A0A3S4BH05_9PEZI|nr:753118c8-fda4-43e6-9521-3727d64494d4 [Thermothielavioides terrestris]
MGASGALSLVNTSAYPLPLAVGNDNAGLARRLPRAKQNSEPPSVSGGRSRSSKTFTTRRSGTRPRPWLFRRTWALPLVLMLAFVSLYALNPTQSNVLHRFFFLSYKLDDDRHGHRYGKGPWDLAFVCFYTVFLSFTREFVMHEVLRPLARRGGIRSRGKQTRFMEQMYTACYIAFIGPLGLFTMHQTPGLWYFETRGMYERFPHTTHAAVFKFYYLFQAAFWVQQAIVMVLGQEKRRKDFRELVAHHIITIALIGLSYRFHFTYMGIAVYITHDISDFFLAISKSLNYLSHRLQVPAFALCIAVWIYQRHYLNLSILRSVATEFATVGPFGLDWPAQQYKCRLSQAVTFALLAALQALNLFWLGCLLRSAYRFVALGVARDERSEGEEDEAEVADDGRARDSRAGLSEKRVGKKGAGVKQC